MIQRVPDELQIWGTEEGFASSAEPPLPIHLSSQIGLPLPDPLGGRLVFEKCLPSPAFRPKLPLHCKNQSDPAEYRRGHCHDPKRPRSEQVECVARAAGGECEQKQLLAKPGQGPRAVYFPFPDLAFHSFQSALHIALRNRHQGFSLAGALRYVHYIQYVAREGTAGLGCRCLGQDAPMTG